MVPHTHIHIAGPFRHHDPALRDVHLSLVCRHGLAWVTLLLCYFKTFPNIDVRSSGTICISSTINWNFEWSHIKLQRFRLISILWGRVWGSSVVIPPHPFQGVASQVHFHGCGPRPEFRGPRVRMPESIASGFICFIFDLPPRFVASKVWFSIFNFLNEY